jgi:hypothetical protein
LQAHAERLGLDRVPVFRAWLVGKEQTYLVMQWPHPVFEHATPNVVARHLDRMAHGQ